MNVMEKSPKGDKSEFLHVCLDDNFQIYAQWEIRPWRYKFVHMNHMYLLDSLKVNARLIGWQENYHKIGSEAKYLDIMVKKEQQDTFIPCHPLLNTYMVEVGVGEGANFFPFLQSSKLHVYGLDETNRNNLESYKWETCVLNQKDWYTQISTYTYYETLGGK